MMNATEFSAIRARWRGAVTHGETGFTAVPDILIRSQNRLGLTSMEVVVLLNLLMHWWRPEDWPYPRMSVIGHRIGTSRRTVERAVQSLEEKGLVRRLRTEALSDGPTIRRFDLSGLIKTLQGLAEESEAVSISDVAQQDRALGF